MEENKSLEDNARKSREKMKTFVIIGLILIIAVYLFWQYSYGLGKEHGRKELIDDIWSTGDIPKFITENNKTTEKSINIDELCQLWLSEQLQRYAESQGGNQ